MCHLTLPAVWLQDESCISTSFLRPRAMLPKSHCPAQANRKADRETHYLYFSLLIT